MGRACGSFAPDPGAGEAVAREDWNPRDFLPSPEPAPDAPPRAAAGAVVGDLAVAVALAVVRLCFRKDIRSFGSALVWAEVPEPKPTYKRLNGLGDLLGRGAGRRSFRLWPGGGTYACCRQNAVIALHRLPPDAVRAVAADLGLAAPGELRDAIDRLPSFEDLPPI